MRTSNCRLMVLVASVALTATATFAGAATLTFKSPEDALRQGVSAFNGGYYELALPALEAVVPTNPVMGKFYLARIYGDNEGSYTDHGRAFKLFKSLADELQDCDPDDETLAPIAAWSLTEVSRYLRRGIPGAGVAADPYAADRALQRAALTFNNEDAQFELAKVLLRGEGPDLVLGGGGRDLSSKIENGRHWLSRLSRQGHAGAQAFLADLLWRGKFMRKDQAAALNLIDVAVSHAPPHERVWIEDIYQNIFCNAGEGVRQQATGRVAEWHSRYGRRIETSTDKSGLADLAVSPVRTCANGEVVKPMASIVEPPAEAPQDVVPPSLGHTVSNPAPSSIAPANAGGLPGGMFSFGPRN